MPMHSSRNKAELSHIKHWPHVYKRHRKKVLKINSREIIIGQIIALCGSILAGYILELNKASLSLFIGAFLLLPGVVDLSASITGAMCAKINHLVDSSKNLTNIVIKSVLFAFLLAGTCGLIVGIVGGVIGSILLDAGFASILKLSVATLLTVGFVTFPSMALLTLLIKKMGFDPDNIIGPLETGFTDALTAFTVVMLVRIL
jgi:cation transporter-like permease